jgi:hypothetical protein
MKTNINKVKQIIFVAEDYHDALPEPHEPSDVFKSMEKLIEDPEENPLRQKLRQSIEELSNEEKTELQALYWLGRGNFATFDQALESARQDNKDITGYLVSKMNLEECLSKGLELLREHKAQH